MTTSLPTASARLGWPDMHLAWAGSGTWAIGGAAGRPDAGGTTIRPEYDLPDGHPAAPR
jgi:hypothetical protein